jgi:GNAT superfamily N-acetyltransferase
LCKFVSAGFEIRSFHESDLDAVVEFSLRAWEPVFESMHQVLGDAIFARLHDPDWRVVQAEAVRSSCTSDERDVFVAIADGRPVGFSAVALNAFHQRIGAMDIMAVDPEYQRRGIGTQLMHRSIEHMRSRGMDIAAVGSGGDPGHAPARAAYEAFGFTPLPGVRYLRLIDQ